MNFWCWIFRGDHGDAKTFFVNYPLAHAHHPGEKIGGDIHFNADINWKLKPCDDVKGDFEIIRNKIRYLYTEGSLKWTQTLNKTLKSILFSIAGSYLQYVAVHEV